METAAAIEAVGAETVLGESDGFYKNLYRIKLQRGEPEPLTYLLYESVVFRRTGCCVLIEILVGIPSRSPMMRRVSSSMSLFDEVKPMKGQL